MPTKRAPSPAAHQPRYVLHRLYAFAWIVDTLQDAPVWARQCPHEDMPQAVADAQEFVRGLVEQGVLMPEVVELMGAPLAAEPEPPDPTPAGAGLDVAGTIM